MKTTKRIAPFLVAAGCLALAACNPDSAGGSTGGTTQAATYLAALDDDYRKLLTKEDVLKHIQLDDPAKLESPTGPEEAVGQGQYGQCVYEWPSDRPPVKISPQFPPMPDMNQVRVSNLEIDKDGAEKALSRFETAYKPMTAAQIEAGMARMEKQFEGKPAEELETAKGFLKARAESTFRHVDDVGDSAFWRSASAMDLPMGAELVVLTGNARFTVTAKTGLDDQENLELAKKIAREILAKAD